MRKLATASAVGSIVALVVGLFYLYTTAVYCDDGGVWGCGPVPVVVVAGSVSLVLLAMAVLAWPTDDDSQC
jgi:hypothetical protein